MCFTTLRNEKFHRVSTTLRPDTYSHYANSLCCGTFNASMFHGVHSFRFNTTIEDVTVKLETQGT